jgi:hypothetical protein
MTLRITVPASMLCLLACGGAAKAPPYPSHDGAGAQPATEAAAPVAAPDSLATWQGQLDQTLADVESLDCPNACRALHSLSRSAEEICKLTGLQHEVCQNAQRRRTDAETRVHERCGTCP